MATPAEDPVPGILHDIKLLHYQVGVLRRKNAERSVAWYKQPPLLLSILALVVSTTTTVGAFVVQSRANNLAALQQLTTEIVDVNLRALDVDQKNPNAITLSSLLTSKREIMLSRAMELIRKMGSGIPPQILYTIGYQEQQDGQAEAAQQLFLQAINGLHKESDYVNEMAARRSLAILYTTPPTSAANLEKGREQFAYVVSSVGNRKDDAALILRAFTYQVWGGQEFINDQLSQGKQAFTNAGTSYRTLSGMNSVQQWLAVLSQAKAATFRATSAAVGGTAKLQGTWKGANNSVGIELNVTPISAGALSCTMSITPVAGPFTGQKQATLYGGINMEDDTVAVLSITTPNFVSPSNPTTTPYRLRLSDPGKTVQIQWPAGGSDWVTLTKS